MNPNSSLPSRSALEIARAFELAEPTGRIRETERRYAHELESRPIRRFADTLLGAAVGCTVALVASRRAAPRALPLAAVVAAGVGLAGPMLFESAPRFWPRLEPWWERLRDAIRGERGGATGSGLDWSTFQGRGPDSDSTAQSST